VLANESDGSGGGFTLSAGDLVLSWNNNAGPGSGITHDVSVRVKLRWVGA
jgi:hypothetical protein